jgi:RNase H-like domain found in reverse transcriptase
MPFLGVVITEDGIRPNKEKTKAIMDIEPPTTLKQLRSVLGIFAYYRKFIPGFSERARPLYELTKKGAGKQFKMTAEAIDAFNGLKVVITSEPIMLHYPDLDQPFEIHTDASGQGIGAILTQRIICLAVVWSVELFRKYIRNRKTTILTDCAALQWLSTRTEGSRVMRWMMRLQEFQLEIRHRRGKKNGNADSLSRAPLSGDQPYKDEALRSFMRTCNTHSRVQRARRNRL